MKKQFLLFVAATLISISSLMAQGQPGAQRMSVEERTKSTMEKFAPFNLSGDATTKVREIIIEFYKNQQSAMEEMRAAGTVDRTAAMEKRKALAEERDTKLKKVLTAEEYSKWVSDIEPSLRPQRPATAPAPAAAPTTPVAPKN